MTIPEIAVIEDSESTYRSLRALLASQYEVKWIQLENEDVKLSSESHPNLYVLDLGLPDCEIGFRILEHLRKKSPTTPIIILTGYCDARTAVRAMKLGANDYIQKPLDPDTFLTTINEMIMTPNRH
ncbi:MAG: response regulator [Candidatus Omnitrophota bacterium]|jgi:DNA-binding response OmpR family regulator|nr:MAG: response regulator [Candidatus Omnitrophota bacterium]